MHNNKKILITGIAGFIGYSFAFKLLKKNYHIIGIDKLDNKLKLNKKRLDNLKKFKNFKFYKLDINDKKIKKLSNIKFTYIFHFAAQAGVRYSKENPFIYLDSNIKGFVNILETFKKQKIKKIFYASSSSVYNEAGNYPFLENNDLKPSSIYGITKKNNEEIANYYSREYNLNIIGLRFFTVYGEWGRPDMFLFKLFKAIINKKKFILNNKGNNYRDFTYIGDVINMVLGLINKKIIKHQIFNICSNKPKKISFILNKFQKKYKFKIKDGGNNKMDMKRTHGCNKKILNISKVKIKTNFQKKSFELFKWYQKNNINKIT